MPAYVHCLTSVGGHVVLVCNRDTNRSCAISWKAKRIDRVVKSSQAGETLATLDSIAETVYMEALLKEMFGSQVDKIPVIIAMDSQNVFRAIYMSSLVEDPWSIVDLAAIKQAIEKEHVYKVIQVAGTEMLANCMTKQGAGGVKLMETLESGLYEPPGGWEQVLKSAKKAQ